MVINYYYCLFLILLLVLLLWLLTLLLVIILLLIIIFIVCGWGGGIKHSTTKITNNYVNKKGCKWTFRDQRRALYKIQHPGMPHKVRCPPAQYSTRRFLQQRSEINYTQQYGKTHVQTICPGDNRSYIATPGSCRHRALAQDVYECFRRTRQKQLSSARIR